MGGGFYIDYILEEELWRSIAVYPISFLGICVLDESGVISISALSIFILAFFVTFAHVSFMVWYRRNEGLVSPSISLILDHMLEVSSIGRRNK